MSNLETSLLLLETQTFIVVYNVVFFYISLIALILPSCYFFYLNGVCTG